MRHARIVTGRADAPPSRISRGCAGPKTTPSRRCSTVVDAISSKLSDPFLVLLLTQVIRVEPHGSSRTRSACPPSPSARFVPPFSPLLFTKLTANLHTIVLLRRARQHWRELLPLCVLQGPRHPVARGRATAALAPVSRLDWSVSAFRLLCLYVHLPQSVMTLNGALGAHSRSRATTLVHVPERNTRER